MRAGSASSREAEGRKAKPLAQAKRGAGGVFFFPAAAAPSEKESGPVIPWESGFSLPAAQGWQGRERRFKGGTHQQKNKYK